MLPASRKSVRVATTLLALVAATAFLAGPALGQAAAGKKAGELSDAQCYGHHREEGFRSMDLFPDTVSMVRKGEVFEFRLTVTVPWLHDILQPFGLVNISGIPGARFPGGEAPLLLDHAGTLSPAAVGPLPPLGSPALGPSVEAVPFTVAENATEVVVLLEGDPGASRRNVWAVEVVAPSGARFASGVPTATEAATADQTGRVLIRVPYESVAQGGLGEWRALARYERGTDPTAPYALSVQVHYNLSQSSELLLRGPEKLAKKTQHTYTFEVVAPPEAMEKASLVYGGKGIAFHKHTDPNAEDYGNYTKWATLEFPVGEQTLVGQGTVVILGPDPDPLMKAWGQVLGFAGSFLLLPAIFLGGTFGPGSVTTLNRVLGGARRRVLWHNASSYLLLVTSLLHMYLFLLEHFWNWSHGIVWGGLSLAAMIGLAVTGAFQRRFVAKWGFERWRFMHFTMGIMVVGFVLVHLLADGSHLASFRQWLAAPG